MGLADRVLKGDVRAAARLISRIEDESPEIIGDMERIYTATGRAAIIGVTGPPGAGKSTLVDSLVAALRKESMSVGVIAIDPTSALTGGAILGDRIRMQRHNTDAGVFIRSLATRGWAGGLARATIGVIHVMDAMGKDFILVETVGSGQVEIDIVGAADTTVVVLNPGSGDDIQALKAGIMEAADIFVVNKADREGAENLKANLEAVIRMKDYAPDRWCPGVFLTEACNDKGIWELLAEVRRHREFLKTSGGLVERRRERARLELLETLEGIFKDAIRRYDRGDYFEGIIDDLLTGRNSPYRAGRELARRLGGEFDRQRDDATG